MPRLLEQVRSAICLKHYSLRTEEAYVPWVREFILFHHKRHPAELGPPEISAFLSHLAVHPQVAASTQNQAASALLFLYREVLARPLKHIDGVQRAKRPARLPVVFTREEVRAVLARLDGTKWLMAALGRAHDDDLHARVMRLVTRSTASDETNHSYVLLGRGIASVRHTGARRLCK